MKTKPEDYRDWSQWYHGCSWIEFADPYKVIDGQTFLMVNSSIGGITFEWGLGGESHTSGELTKEQAIQCLEHAIAWIRRFK